MYVSVDTVAFLLDMTPNSVRDLLDEPRSGLSVHIRTVPDTKLGDLATQDIAKSYGTRLPLWTVATYVAKRERSSKWDTSTIRDPTRAEVRREYWRLVAAAAVYRLLKATLKKLARGAEADLKRGLEATLSHLGPKS